MKRLVKIVVIVVFSLCIITLFRSCIKAALPQVTTLDVTEITSTSALSGGIITDDGGGTVNARGICWATTENPDVNKSKTIDGSGTGSFTSQLTGLTDGTTYYIKAYATNSAGTAYGNEFCIITPVTDVEGKVYKTVKIGVQVWMAENLETARYNNGEVIPTPSDPNEVIPNDPTSKYHLASFYTWYAVMDNRNVCPGGWHIPSKAEWTELVNSAGGFNTAGDKLDALCGINRWRCCPEGGSTETNETGLTLTGGGRHTDMGGYMIVYGIYERGYWWSSDENSTASACAFLSSWCTPAVSLIYLQKNEGVTVRCLKN